MESMYKESLFQAISKGEVVLWAGAGLSLYAGLPSGVQLREILYEGLTPLEKNQTCLIWQMKFARLKGIEIILSKP